MRTIHLIPVVLIFGLTACTRSDRAEVRDETRARTESAADVAAEKRREYERRTEERLARIDRAMEEEQAKVKGRKLSTKAKRQYNERMAELRNMRKETSKKYDELKGATGDGWERFKDGVDGAADKLDRSWDSFVADMKS